MRRLVFGIPNPPEKSIPKPPPRFQPIEQFPPNQSYQTPTTPLKPILKTSDNRPNSTKFNPNLRNVPINNNPSVVELDEILDEEERRLFENFDQYLLRLRRLQEDSMIAQHVRDMKNGKFGPIEQKAYRQKQELEKQRMDREEKEMRVEFSKLIFSLRNVTAGKFLL